MLKKLNSWECIFNKNGIEHAVTENKPLAKRAEERKRANKCHLNLVNLDEALGQEFDNVIYVASNVHLGQSNTITGDLFGCQVLQCVSRPKANLHIITYDGKDMSRFWDHHKQYIMLLRNENENQEHETLELGYLSFRYETLGMFLFPHLINEGVLTFHPSKGQENYVLADVVSVLQKGRNLKDQVSAYVSNASDLLKRKLHKKALRCFVEAAHILFSRIGNRRLSGRYFQAGVNQGTNSNNTDNDPFGDELTNDCEFEEIKLYLKDLKSLDEQICSNIATCLFHLDRTEDALYMMLVKFMENQSDLDAVSFLAKCYLKLGQKDVARWLFLGLISKARFGDYILQTDTDVVKEALSYLTNNPDEQECCQNACPHTKMNQSLSSRYFQSILTAEESTFSISSWSFILR